MTPPRASRRAPAGSPRGTWLIDGHNVIGRSAELARLQGAERGEEARTRLLEACSRMAHRHGVRVILVFDGLAAGVARESTRRSRVEVVFASGPGRADAYIIEQANRLTGSGSDATVVSDDRGLQGELLRGVGRRSVREFWSAVEGEGASGKSRTAGSGSADTGEKQDPGPLPDVEQHFLEAEARARAQARAIAPRKGPSDARTGVSGARKKGKKA